MCMDPILDLGKRKSQKCHPTFKIGFGKTTSYCTELLIGMFLKE